MQADAESRNGPMGYAAILAAVTIWAGWIVATRAEMLAHRAPLDLAILRYAAPALLLAPFWLRRGLWPRGESPLLLAIMTIGWGAPFALLLAQGLRSVEASLFGPLVPGLLPMVVAFWARAVEGAPIRRGRGVGLCFIALAVALVLGPALVGGGDGGDGGVLRGAPWLLAACVGWSSYTIAFRRTGLSGAEGAAYVSLYSTPFLLAGALIFGTALPEAGLAELAVLTLEQGVLAGALSVIAFGYSVKTLGVARASAFTSLVPALAALGGWLVLGEAVGVSGWLAAGATCMGVLLVNRYA